VLEYHDLAQHLPDDQPFYGLQSLGLDGQSTPLTSIAEMAAAYITEMRQIQPTGPYYLGGRSFGGSVAYEMARQLHQQGETVGMLAMLDTYPLGWLKLCAAEDARRYEKEFFQLRITRHFDNLRRINLAEKLHYVLSKAQYKKRKYKNWWWQLRSNFGQTSAQSLKQTLRNIEESNYRAAKQYVPHAYPGRVTFFCASEEVSAEENIAGWQTLAAAVEVVRVPGDHQTMIQLPHVAQLAKQLTDCLAQAMQSNGG
jgi:thioesterase domain-containing protein